MIYSEAMEDSDRERIKGGEEKNRAMSKGYLSTGRTGSVFSALKEMPLAEVGHYSSGSQATLSIQSTDSVNAMARCLDSTTLTFTQKSLYIPYLHMALVPSSF